MNWDQVRGKWMEMKGEIKQRWGKLTDDDLTVINGKREALAGKLIERIIMPTDRSIIGFDRRGNVFLLGRADGGIQWIERVRWRN